MFGQYIETLQAFMKIGLLELTATKICMKAGVLICRSFMFHMKIPSRNDVCWGKYYLVFDANIGKFHRSYAEWIPGISVFGLCNSCAKFRDIKQYFLKNNIFLSILKTFKIIWENITNLLLFIYLGFFH